MMMHVARLFAAMMRDCPHDGLHGCRGTVHMMGCMVVAGLST